MSVKLPSNDMSVTRVVQRRLVTPMLYDRCSHTALTGRTSGLEEEHRL
jgi:hypothetical protein